MAMVVLNYVINLWPFSVFKFDDLKASNSLVKKLAVPESTKRFVYAIQEPQSQAVIYVLCVQNLSERSAFDAECLIKEVKPDAVMVHVGPMEMENGPRVDEVASKDCNFSFFSWITNGNNRRQGPDEYMVPTSSFEVLRSCFVHKINRESYETAAGNLVLKEIFGVGFNGHFLSAKRAAEEVGASFLLLESPFVKCHGDSEPSPEKEEEIGNKLGAFGLQPSSLVPQRAPSIGSVSSSVFRGMNNIQSQVVKSMSSYLTDSGSVMGVGSEVVQPRVDYEAPQFAQSIYPLLVDLHDIFVDIPSMGRALAHAQKMLSDINKGEIVDSKLLSEVFVFRIAVEALRIALNSAGRLPIDQLGNAVPSETKFSELPVEDKSHALVAEAVRSQTKEFKSIVAIVDSSCLAGLRRHWNTPVPLEIKDIVEQLVTVCEGKMQNGSDRKRLLADKPVVAVGAGATAILGASSFSKVVPASTLAKMLTYKVPASIKLMMAQTHKVVTFAFGKTLGPSKVVAPGMAGKTSSFKVAASAEKIHTVVHSIIAHMEKTSLSAMRTTFGEIMRKRNVKRVGFLPLATFGFSIATCASLLTYGDGIECAAESLPAAPSIASLGRGIQSLHQASQAVRQEDSSRIPKSIESLLHRFRKIKVQ